MRISFLLFIALFLPMVTFAQADTTLQAQPTLFQKLIIPTGLIVTGSLMSGKTIELKLKDNVLQKTSGIRQTKIDNLLPFVPIGEMYLADLLGVKARNHWFDQSKNLFMTIALNQIITSSFKQLINKTRPNGGQFSMPSGHTSSAFAMATVLYEEYKSTNPVLAYSGFGFSTAAGTLRIINNKHWLSDVLVGAGVGILSAKIIYHFEPFKNWNPVLRQTKMAIYPSFTPYSYSIRAVVVR